MMSHLNKLNKFFLCLGLWLLVPSLAQSQVPTRPYLIETPLPLTLGSQTFSPLLISGNGEVIYGDAGFGLAMWTKLSGITPVMKIEFGYNLFPKATDLDGADVAGFFTLGDTVLNEYGLFRWSEHTGVELIKPLFIPPPIGGVITSIQIGDGGHHISFMCSNPQTSKPACSSDAILNEDAFVGKFWSSVNGFQSEASLSHGNFDYITTSGDFKTHIVGVLGTANFGRLDYQGKYNQFQNFPANFNPETDKVIMNRDATFVVVEEAAEHEVFAWNQIGDLISPFKLPAGCEGFEVSNIDDNGAFFGTAYCPTISAPSSENIGLRVTLTSAETIHEWLQGAGLQNNLGPVTVLQLVSNNGKTVYGETNIHAVVGGDHLSNLPETSAFIAHVP